MALGKLKNHHGLFRAVVKDNKDPKNLKRLKLVIAQTTGAEVTDWAWPIFSTSKPPAIGSGVFAGFFGGDPEYPFWLGEFGTSGGGPQGVFSYGAWFDTTTQTITSGATKSITVNTTDLSSGISVKNNSRFTVDYDGTYNLQFSCQLFRDTGGGNGNTVQIWLAKNGTAVPSSNTRIDVTTNAPSQVASWNFYSKLKKNDYLELKWTANTSSMKILAASASGGIPAIPSVIVTMNQIT
jgi:Type VI secretion system/phage-baseplate injector OB domain